ncbi:GNAT family N-acetyltransferase [Marinomonas shanghaiensis]|uniref:GNAT family N-acetyltransferase n=1 Tax=Marinomonas shanghaiensis TaxID=2202418 RepID=UPI000DB9A21B|nr:GNAT family N-acetyltransferase [Marinomonas shanghaiensis]
MNKTKIHLLPVSRDELRTFKTELQETFTAALVDQFSQFGSELIPSDDDINESFNAHGAVIRHIFYGQEKVGGVVLKINEDTQHNSLDLFFIYPKHHDKGFGLATWKTIEATYPGTKIWSTITPYFEKRNIHFYVNKCGFQIVEFFNKNHLEKNEKARSSAPHDTSDSSEEEFFKFEKVMVQKA